MQKIVKNFFLILLGIVLAACGGGGGEPFTGGGGSIVDSSVTPAAKVIIFVDNPEIKADGTTTVAITVTAVDSNNAIIEGAEITVSADTGIIELLDSLTDESGQVTAILSTGGDETERTITVSASSSQASSVATIEVVETLSGVSVSGLVLLASAEQMDTDGLTPVTLTAIITDSNHVVLEGAEVVFSANSGALQVTLPITNLAGQALATLSTGGDESERTITVLASSGSLSDTITIDVVDSPASLTIDSLELLVSSPQLGSSGLDTIDVTAIAKDTDNVVTAEVEVAFATSSGTLQVTQPITDIAGQALAVLSTEGNTENRTITVTASAGSLTSMVTVDITGTNLVISGENSFTQATSSVLTIQLKDSDGNPIKGKALVIESSAGNGLTPTNGDFVTDNSGETQVTVQANVVGSDTITASAEGTTGSFVLSVSPDQFTFVSPIAGTEIDIDGPAEGISIRWLSNGVPQVGKTVNFTTTRGTLSASASVTDASGVTTMPAVTITSNNAGPAIITAFVTDGPSAVVAVEFIATKPAAITLQADKTTIGPNDGSEAEEQKAILTATLRDPDNNLVKGKTLRFSIVQDTSGGTLTNATAVTNSLGQASISYVSSAATSATDEVLIRVEVEEDTTVDAEVMLTVAQKSLFVVLGTGNSIGEPNQAQYDFPYSVLVTDSGGNPVEGVLVTIKVSPTRYYKGWWILINNVWITRGGTDMVADLTSTADPYGCTSEDLNNNGILDILPVMEDFNSNGRLDPGNVVAVPTSLMTDENGTALFNLRYGQEFGRWIEVALSATTEVNGTESIDVETFTLPVSADDVTVEDVPPPAVRSDDIPEDLVGSPGVTINHLISPFGWMPDCTIDE